MTRINPELTLLLQDAAANLGIELDEQLLNRVIARRDERIARGGKKCDRCYQTKSLGDFYDDPSRPDGLRRICKECMSEVAAERYRRNRAQLI